MIQLLLLVAEQDSPTAATISTYLSPLVKDNLLCLHDSNQIKVAEDNSLTQILQTKKISHVLFFLSAESMSNNHLYEALQAAHDQQIAIYVLYLRPCLYQDGFVNRLPFLSQKSISEQISEDRALYENTATLVRHIAPNHPIPSWDEKQANDPKHSYPKRLNNAISLRSQSDIVGRSKDIAQLHQQLTQHQEVVVVNAISGLGKTTLLQVYTDTYYDAYRHILWINQQDNESLHDAFLDAKGLLYNLNIDTANIPRTEWFDILISRLHRIADFPCLLVIDNVQQDIAEYSSQLPTPPNWHILMSSRQNIEGYTTLQLDHLSPEDALQLFNKNYGRTDISLKDRQKLLQQIDYHTLVIEILAKTAKHMELSAETLHNALTQNVPTPAQTLHSQERGQKVARVMSYLMNIFDISDITPDATHLLQQFACLPNDFIPTNHLQQLLCNEPTFDRTQLFLSIAELHQKGWLLSNEQQDHYKMHTIVAQVLRHKMNIQLTQTDTLLTALIDCLSIDQSKDNPVDKFVWIPYGKHFADLFAQSNDTNIAQLQNNLATVLQHLGDYEPAKNYFLQAIDIQTQHFGTQHPTLATSYSNLALVLQDLGDYEQAKDYLLQAIALQTQHFGAQHPTLATLYSNLATVLRDLGDYEPAKDYLLRAIALETQHFGTQHPTLATHYSNLALVLRDLGDYEQAKDYLLQAIALETQHFGTQHPTLATSYSNLATVLRDLGDYEPAKDYLLQAIALDTQYFGTEHPTLATHYSNLALVLRDLGDYEQAKDYLLQAIALQTQYFGTEHPTLATSYGNLATVLKDLGDYEPAKDYLLQAIALDTQHFGTEHPTLATRYSNLGTVLRNLGDYEQAKDYLLEAIALQTQYFGTEHPTLATSYGNLATVLKDLGDYEQAKDYLLQAIDLQTQHFGTQHPTLATRYSNLALVLQDLGDYEPAKDYLLQAIAIGTQHFGTQHPTLATRYSNLATVLQDLGDYEQAKDYLLQAIALETQHFGTEHPTLAISYGNLGYLYIVMRNKTEGLSYLQKALSIFQQSLPPQHPHIVQTSQLINWLS
ncbi:MAG: tetratricopeptide repeat protein [Chitinophagales bacterium]|nr:tetratricopeptide repeat protein [Chitinophagales bacterium]